jgi:hypothetical protein
MVGHRIRKKVMHRNEIKVLHPSKRELYVSFLLAASLFIWSPSLPHRLSIGLFTASLLIVAIVCAVNGLLDFKRMSHFERVIAVLWFFALFGATSLYIEQLIHPKFISPRHGG